MYVYLKIVIYWIYCPAIPLAEEVFRYKLLQIETSGF